MVYFSVGHYYWVGGGGREGGGGGGGSKTYKKEVYVMVSMSMFWGASHV